MKPNERSYIEGPRWVLSSGWIEKEIIDCNAVLRCKGLSDIEILSVSERTSWTRRTIFYRLRGPTLALEVFQKTIEASIRQYNTCL